MITSKITDFIYGTSLEDFPASTVRMAKLAFLDWLGSVAAGKKQSPAQMILGVVEELGGNSESTILANGCKSSCLNAALVNGAISHIIELDDVHRTSIIHPAAPIIPAALAAAEKEHAGGRELITSIVLGYEVAIRVAEAITPSHYYYWHTTGTCGTFGAAAAAAKVFRLNRDGITWALGNAGTQAAGLWEFLNDGAMSKHLHPGKAAMNGLLACLLARRGFTGATRILEGERGFCRATAGEIDLNRITVGLGNGKFKIEEISFKIHSSCRHTHSAIDTMLELAQKHNLAPEDVKTIKVSTYKTAMDITNNFTPESPYAAKFSLPFCIALALKEQRCAPKDFSEASLTDAIIRSIMEKIEIIVDPELNAHHPELWPTMLEICTRTGEIVKGSTDYPQGDPENPVTHEQLEHKFLDLASGPWGEKKAASIMQLYRNLEDVSDLALALPF